MTDVNQTEAPKCSATTKLGAPCRTYARPGHQTCWSHSTDIPDEVKSAHRARGGYSTAHQKGAASAAAQALVEEVARATTPGEIALTLTKVYAAVLAGTVPARVGAVAAQLANAAIKAYSSDVSARLKRLEAKLAGHPELLRAWQGEG